jgi:hypothetical protein
VNNFAVVLPVLMLLLGVVLMYWTTQFNRNLLNTQERFLGKYITGAVVFGLWIFLVSVGAVITVGSYFGKQAWTTYETIEIIILGLIGGILAVIGALWQFFIVTRFRNIGNQKSSR